MRMISILAFAILAVTCINACETGFDSDQLVSQAEMTCLRNAGYTFFIGQIYNNGQVNQNGVQSIANARAAGYTGLVDAYVTPCVNSANNCPSGTQQAADAINNLLKTNGANIGRVWLQVLAGQWPDDPTSNQNFINQFAAQVRAQQPQFGILSDAESWENVTGPGYSGDSQYQLWWAEHNGIADYIGWETFGGWSVPSMHQYNSNVQLNSACSTTANQDWFF